MLISEVADLFRTYMDETDQTFVNDAMVSTWLIRAYDDFRCMVTEIDPTIYSSSQIYTLSSARRLDLAAAAVPILGPTADPRMYQIVNIYEVEASDTDSVLRMLIPSTSLKSTYDALSDYNLRGSELVFNGEISMTIRVDFIPEPTAAQTAAWNALGASYIDDLNRFHDIIALIAYLQYAVVDAADSPQLQALLGRRQQQLMAYLENRSGGVVESGVDVRWM